MAKPNHDLIHFAGTIAPYSTTFVSPYMLKTRTLDNTCRVNNTTYDDFEGHGAMFGSPASEVPLLEDPQRNFQIGQRISDCKYSSY
ncbi:MAG: hypothetical protein J0L97_02925 [Alphaproteobacteria bacterium]|nr:hypothetical protein [Alphaproteobacteria bacterium]